MGRQKRDDPRCDHGRMVNRVTSLQDGVEWRPGMGIFSVWVCEQRGCVLDAMGWVERGVGTPAFVYGPLAHLAEAVAE